ncbi:hypothetical protein QR680_002190 [Steinernema hermaphroditum]|uniref:Protein tincar n=1 Tax=Steinernema hermaphroditum TaxID=289476 RepID=A0AA39LH86_9BILA|nr:hypothetical protein QR680_002190 [Steinernema hermaphroditum]
MGCFFRSRLNSLGSIWYTLICVLLQIYLCYLGFERYRLYSDMKWPHGGYPRVWLTVYISLYAACVPMVVFIFATGCFKTGNLAGDQDQFGARTERIFEIRPRHDSSMCSPRRCIRALWQHSPPLPQLLHITVALCQLFAQQVMLAQLYKYGFINSADFLNTEMDFIYHRARQLATNLPMGDTRLQGFRITSEELSGSPLAPNLLPVLMNARLFGIPLEFTNLVIALIAYAITYPTVFWRVSKTFSLFFSFNLFIHGATVVYSYIGFSVLYRIQETNYNSIRPVGLGQYITPMRIDIMNHPLSIIVCFVATIILMHIAPISYYALGYNNFFIALIEQRNKHSTESQKVDEGACTEYSELRQRAYQSRPPAVDLCCAGYGPHAASICLLFLTAASKIPVGYTLMKLMEHDDRPLILSCIIVDFVYLFAWLFFWILLAIKKSWNFKVIHGVHEIISLQNAHKITDSSKCPGELKNALVLMHGDQMYVTDDVTIKQALLRTAQQSGMHVNTSEAYWLKGNDNASPNARRIALNEGKGTPEMRTLLNNSTYRRQSDENALTSSNIYYNGGRTPQGIQLPPQYQAQIVGANNYRADNTNSVYTFGTLQRTQNKGDFNSTIRTPQLQQAVRQYAPLPAGISPETYASIHKNSRDSKVDQIMQRRASQGREGPDSYVYASNYATYARTPQNKALQVVENRRNEGIYGKTGEGHNASRVNSVTASPVLSEKVVKPNIMMREQSPYQRTNNTGLSSFNNGTGVDKVYGTISSNWGTQQRTVQPPQALTKPTLPPIATPSANVGSSSWHQPVPYAKIASMSASSSQQDPQCFTPTSTLTSQGSVGNYNSQQTPTPGSPVTSVSLSTYNSGPRYQQIYGNVGEDPGELTYGTVGSPTVETVGTIAKNNGGVNLQTIPSANSLRMQMKSGAVGNSRPTEGTAENGTDTLRQRGILASGTDYATSVV